MPTDLSGTQVLDVVQRTSKDGSTTMWDVLLGDGAKYTTFDPAMKDKAVSLFSQDGSIRCDARVEVTQKPNPRGGMFTNYNLVDIAHVGQLPAAAMQAGTVVGGAQGGSLVGQQTQATPAQQGGTGSLVGAPQQDEYQRRLHPEVAMLVGKQEALNTAAIIVAGILTGIGPEGKDQAREITLELGKAFYNAVHEGPETENTENGTATVPVQTPDEIAQAANEAAGEQVVQVGPPADASKVKWA